MERTNRKARTGVVVSDKMDKSVVVSVKTLVRHPLYGRIQRRTRRFMAHDAENQCHIGDKVAIAETRPFSRRKRWRVTEILERAKA